MVAFVLSVTLALLSHGGTQNRAHSTSTVGHLPQRGIIIPGVSFAGIKIGDTQARVLSVWGNHYVPCKYCKDATWLYEYRGAEPLGAAVRFQKGLVVAVFSLGSPAGWKTDKGLFMGDPIANVYQYYNNTTTVRCIGFDAVTAKTGKYVTGFYSAAGVVYGFAMVIPTLTICQ